MKRFVLIPAFLLLLAGSCRHAEEQLAAPKAFTVEELDRPVAPEGGPVTVTLSSTVDYEVRLQAETDWISVGEKTSTSLSLDVEANLEDYMRDALLSFYDRNGDWLGEVGLIQKAGQGIVFEPEPLALIPAAGGTFPVRIEANVEYDYQVEEAAQGWLAAAPADGGITVTATENTAEAARKARITFHRTGKDRMVGYLDVEQRGLIHRVKLDGTPLESLEAALDLLPAKTEAAVLELGLDTFDTPVRIDGRSVTVPVTIAGQGEAAETVLRALEIYKAQVTVRNLTLAPDGTVRPTLAETGYNNPFGLFVHRAGYGVTVENVVFDLSGAASGTTGLFWLNDASERGTTRDVLRGSTIRGVAGERNAQIYGGFLELAGNTFSGGHSAYGVRIGGSGNDVLIDGNRFIQAGSAAAYGVQFYQLRDSQVTIGDGEGDTNQADASFRSTFGADADVNANGNTFSPKVVWSDGPLQVNSKLLTRVWGKYTRKTDSWDASILHGKEWDRNAAMDRDHIYVPVTAGSNAGSGAGEYGVAVFDRRTGAHSSTITAGFDAAAGHFATCAATMLRDGDNEVILVSNMVREANTNPVLKIYSVKADASSATLLFTYDKITAANGNGEHMRIGDRMTAWGDWTEGKLFFVEYNLGATPKRKLYIFSIHNGVIAAEDLPLGADGNGMSPELNVDNASVGGNGNHMNTFTMYGNDIEGLYSGTQTPRIFNRWWTGEWHFDQTGHLYKDDYAFENSMLDPQFFSVGGQDYLCYVSTLNVATAATGYLRVLALPAGETLAARLEAFKTSADLEAASEVYALGDVKDIRAGGTIATSGTGYCQVLTVQEEGGEKTYIVAGVTGAGMSLFQVNR